MPTTDAGRALRVDPRRSVGARVRRAARAITEGRTIVVLDPARGEADLVVAADHGLTVLSVFDLSVHAH